jgi:hypothetical protein
MHIERSAKNMKTLLLSIQILCAALPCVSANDAATPAAKAHLKNFFSGNTVELAKSYADEVLLMPGHEFLKPEYGIANDAQRMKATEVKNTVLVAAISKKIGGRPSPPVEKINEKLEAMTFTALDVTPGDFTTDPTDPVATADGKLHFAVVKGDQIIKISPPKGDFLLLQLRSINGKWQVAEYLD